jgi:hypothetical protein
MIRGQIAEAGAGSEAAIRRQWIAYWSLRSA